ncbi:hypothetical protein A8F53_00965 [Burkholderia cenocepacia]|nr:hypothetical protein A8F53_00965 [Burkholderia cenocepacia]
MAENAVPRRQYTNSRLRRRLAERAGQHEAARRLACRWRRWGTGAVVSAMAVRRPQRGRRPLLPSSSRRPVSDLEAEVSRLRKELASAKLDIEILRKATAYFAKGSR